MNRLFDLECKFLCSIGDIAQFDRYELDRPEVLFYGRSNSGKSSIINAIVRKTIAHVSKTPGKTKTLNVFSIGSKANIIDMPGYGYASAAKHEILSWSKLIEDYFCLHRKQMKHLYVLVDNKVGLKESDLYILGNANTKMSIILTKCDKSSENEIKNATIRLKEEIAINGIQIDTIFSTSSKTNLGIDAVRAHIDHVTKK